MTLSHILKSMKSKNCPKFFHRINFAFWIEIWNPNLCKSHTFWNRANIEKWILVSHTGTWWPKSMKSEKLLEIFHRVIFAFWMQICNPNLCKSHTFWNIANTVKWPCFAYTDLMTEINEIEKIVQNSFIGQFLCSEFKYATQIYVHPINFEIQLLLKTDLVSHTRTWW